MGQEKASSIVTLILFFGVAHMSLEIGFKITNNYDVVTIITYLTSFFTVLWYLKSKKGLLESINFKIPQLNMKLILKILFYCVIYLIADNFILDILVNNFNININNFDTNFVPYHKTYLGWVIFVISLTICPAVSEELVFRGIIFKNFIPKFGLKISIIITSIIFSFMHGISNGMVIFLSGSSLYVAYTYYKEKNLLYPILFHTISNLFCAIPENKFNTSDKTTYLLFFLIALPIILRKNYQIFILEKNVKFRIRS